MVSLRRDHLLMYPQGHFHETAEKRGLLDSILDMRTPTRTTALVTLTMATVGLVWMGIYYRYSVKDNTMNQPINVRSKLERLEGNAPVIPPSERLFGSSPDTSERRSRPRKSHEESREGSEKRRKKHIRRDSRSPERYAAPPLCSPSS